MKKFNNTSIIVIVALIKDSLGAITNLTKIIEINNNPANI